MGNWADIHMKPVPFKCNLISPPFQLVSLWWVRICLARLVWYGNVLKHNLHLNGARLKWTLTCPTNWWRWCRIFWHIGHLKILTWPKAKLHFPRISCKVKPFTLLSLGSPSINTGWLVESPTGKEEKSTSITLYFKTVFHFSMKACINLNKLIEETVGWFPFPSQQH